MHQTGFSWQRGFFTALGKKYVEELDLIYYYLSQMTRGKMYPTEFLDEYFDDYKNKMDSFSLHLQRNMKVIVEYMKEYDLKFNELFECDGIREDECIEDFSEMKKGIISGGDENYSPKIMALSKNLDIDPLFLKS